MSLSENWSQTFGKSPLYLQKQICNALSTGPLERIFNTESDDVLNVTMEASAVNQKEVEDRQMRSKRYIKLEKEDAERKAHNWEEEVKIAQKLDAQGRRLLR